jgi:hypothetical protein
MDKKKTKLAEIKTKETESSVEGFLHSVDDVQKREDSFTLLEMMKEVSGEDPKMWGTSLIGFGKKIYKSPATGREVEWFVIGFSPRKANLSLHLTIDINQHATSLEKLGKHKTGAGCLYVNKLQDVNLEVLKDLMKEAIK